MGIDFEGPDAITSQFEKAVIEVEALHANLSQVEDVATEIVLVRACADVCKVVHLLRANGRGAAVAVLERYDKVVQGTLERLTRGSDW